MEAFIDRTEETLESPKKPCLTKSGVSPKELSVVVTNGHSSNMLSTSPASSPSILTDEDMEQTVFSTTSIHMENRVSTGADTKLQAKDHVFSSSSSNEDDISIKLPLNSSPSTSKGAEEVRSYYTPGFSIRAWASEDIQHKRNEPVTSTITHVEQKERKTSVTSTLTINKHKDFELEKKSPENTEVSSLAFNVGQSKKKETNTVEVTLNRSIEYDLEDRSPQKKEFSHATFNIGKSKTQKTSANQPLFHSPHAKSPQQTDKVDQVKSAETVGLSAMVSSQDTVEVSGQIVKDDWVIISEEESLCNEVSRVSLPKVPSPASIQQFSDSLAVSGNVTSAPIEVERKFTIYPETEAKLINLGAKLKNARSFTDIYFDNEAYTLTLSDCWLRRRNTSWEMKIPFNTGPIFDISTKYQELCNEADIVDFISKKLNIKAIGKSDINSLVEKAGLVEFANINTTRKSYVCDGCTIDLDSTDSGFNFGEIEVMASSAAEISIALHSVENMAKTLGWSALQLVH